jgi:hypothetical protein
MFNLNQTGNGGCVKRSNKKSAKLVLVLSALWLVAGCTQDKKPAPYRGTWLRNISINSKLAQKFGEKHFDVANSCVQMIRAIKPKTVSENLSAWFCLARMPAPRTIRSPTVNRS